VPLFKGIIVSRRPSVICLALLAACLPGVRATPVNGPATFELIASRAVGQTPFRPYGYYSLVGAHPKGLEDFDTIQYWRKEDEQSGPDISERLSGVNERGGTRYRYSTISINRRRFVFTTVKVKGTSYSFAGRFLRTDFVNADMDFDKPVLAGRLVKYRNGKKVAEANVRLSYFAGT
jgi:hypothetical protein